MPQTQYNLHLKGFVGGCDFDRNYVDYILGKNVGKPVNVLIDSLGGSVATALSITSAFKNHGDVTVHFVGMNASAATIASLGAKHISIDANAMYLVHKCSQSFFEWGSLNADQFAQLIADCEQIKADLDKLDVNIASMYAKKCKKNSKDLLDLMKVGGWLSAQEALSWGFVDEITDLPDEAAPKLSDAVAAEMAAAGIPIPNVPLGGNPEPGNGDSAIAKFIAALTAFFKPTKSHSDMNTEPTNTTQEPGATAPVTPSADAQRIADLEAQVASLTAERDSLKAENDTLKAGPAATTTAVVEDGKTVKEPTDNAIQQFCNDAAEARKMYNLLH